MIMGRAAIGALLAATVALTGTTPALATEGPAGRVVSGTVDPTTLPTGAAPGIPWLDQVKVQLHQPGRRTVSVRSLAGELLHARGGYVLGGDRGYGAVFVTPSGKRRVLDRSRSLGPALTSQTGAWAVMSDNYGKRLRVVRTSDGHLVRGRVLPEHWNARVVAAGDGQVLLSLVGPGRTPSTVRHRTVLWDPVRNTTRTLVERASTTASFGAHRVAVTAGNRQLVLDLRTQKVLWRTPAGRTQPPERVISFSPDDKRVLTVSFPATPLNQDQAETVHRVVRVRDASTGRVLTTLRGHFAFWLDEDASPAVWETSTRLLLVAGSEPRNNSEFEPYLPDRTLVRCSVTTARCVTVPVQAGTTNLLVRKSN